MNWKCLQVPGPRREESTLNGWDSWRCLFWMRSNGTFLSARMNSMRSWRLLSGCLQWRKACRVVGLRTLSWSCWCQRLKSPNKSLTTQQSWCSHTPAALPWSVCQASSSPPFQQRRLARRHEPTLPTPHWCLNSCLWSRSMKRLTNAPSTTQQWTQSSTSPATLQSTSRYTNVSLTGMTGRTITTSLCLERLIQWDRLGSIRLSTRRVIPVTTKQLQQQKLWSTSDLKPKLRNFCEIFILFNLFFFSCFNKDFHFMESFPPCKRNYKRILVNWLNALSKRSLSWRECFINYFEIFYLFNVIVEKFTQQLWGLPCEWCDATSLTLLM